MTSRSASQEMSRAVVTIEARATLRAALESMQGGHFRHLPVIDDNELVGILSDRDLRIEAPDLLVADVMTKCVETCDESDSLGDVADRMVEHEISALPVVDGQRRLIGIVTSSDLLKYLRRTHRWETGDPFERLVVSLRDIADCED